MTSWIIFSSHALPRHRAVEARGGVRGGGVEKLRGSIGERVRRDGLPVRWCEGGRAFQNHLLAGIAIDFDA